MTSSFVKVLSRHTGPWKFYAAMPDNAKGKPQGQWMPEKYNDPINDAFALMDKWGGAIIRINAWSVSEEQFVMTITPEDRERWNAEKENWQEAARTVAKETAATFPTVDRPIKMSSDVTMEQVAKVLKLRGQGLGYVAIEKAMGINNKKGFWAWKIVKATQKK